jgi:flagellar hook-associated protein 3 FlgL
MRVSSDLQRTVFMNALADAQQRLAKTQEQVSTGQRVNSPSDDPAAAARIAQLNATLARLDQFKSNADFATNQLGLEENALTSVVDNLQQIRELTVQANNAPLSDTDRAAIADELRQRLAALQSVANSTDVDGRHLFAGYNEGATPFTVGPSGNVVYNGDQGQRSVQISETRFIAINDSGADVFQRIPTGNGTFTLAADAANTGSGVLGAGTVVDQTAWVPDNYTITFVTPTTYEVRDSASALVASGTYTAGQAISFRGISVPIDGAPAAGDKFDVAPSSSRDIFATVSSLIDALNTPASSDAARTSLHNKLGQALADIDQATNHVIATRSDVGSRSKALDDETSLGADFKVQLTTTLSNIRDLDYADALTKLSQQQLGLQAAEQAFAQTQGLSLFRFL